MPTRDWDADAYDRLPIPMTGWGTAVVDRMRLTGDERVLDAGCGTGQVTVHLRERLPRGHVIALDGSSSMIANARARLGTDRVTYLVHDLLEPIPIDPVDAIVSTATFHWIADHDRLFANLAAVLRPGGRLHAQCGGRGNIANVTAIVHDLRHDAAWDKVFPGPEETARRLEHAGFTDVRCWLADEPTLLPAEDLPLYLRTVCLGGVVEGLPADEAARLVDDVAARMSEPRIDYVRLSIDAVRSDEQ
jgi:trans-aconitate 2-methyltransferase